MLSDLTLKLTPISQQTDTNVFCIFLLIACSNFLKAPAATFTSPSYPAFYSSNIQCWILIHADFTEIIQITFGSFSVEKSEENGCEADYVQVR